MLTTTPLRAQHYIQKGPLSPFWENSVRGYGISSRSQPCPLRVTAKIYSVLTRTFTAGSFNCQIDDTRMLLIWEEYVVQGRGQKSRRYFIKHEAFSYRAVCSCIIGMQHDCAISTLIKEHVENCQLSRFFFPSVSLPSCKIYKYIHYKY